MDNSNASESAIGSVQGQGADAMGRWKLYGSVTADEVRDLRAECARLRDDVDNLKRALGVLRSRVNSNEMAAA